MTAEEFITRKECPFFSEEDMIVITTAMIEFAKYHVLKRAIKSLLTPINSPLSMLQQITKLSDLKKFS